MLPSIHGLSSCSRGRGPSGDAHYISPVARYITWPCLTIRVTGWIMAPPQNSYVEGSPPMYLYLQIVSKERIKTEWGHRGGALPFLWETSESSLPSPCWGHDEMAPPSSQEESSYQKQPCWHLDLGFWPSRTVKNWMSVVKVCPVHGILLCHPELTDAFGELGRGGKHVVLRRAVNVPTTWSRQTWVTACREQQQKENY